MTYSCNSCSGCGQGYIVDIPRLEYTPPSAAPGLGYSSSVVSNDYYSSSGSDSGFESIASNDTSLTVIEPEVTVVEPQSMEIVQPSNPTSPLEDMDVLRNFNHPNNEIIPATEVDRAVNRIRGIEVEEIVFIRRKRVVFK